MKLKTLMKWTPKAVRERAGKVVILALKRLKRTGKIKAQVKSIDSKRKKTDKYICEIEYANPQDFKKGKSIFDVDVKVSCSCDFFKYYLEVALANRKAADIKYSNGKLPIEKNPKMKPYLCKHLFKVAYVLYKKKL